MSDRTGLRRPSRLLPALMLVLLAGGCGSPAPLRPDLFYALDPEPLESPLGTPLPATLLVSDLAARGFLGGRQIVFRTEAEPLQVQRYDDLLWADPVPHALARNLVRAVRHAQVFEFAVIPADRARADYLLGGAVERFEHLPTATPPRVAGALNLALVRADDRRTLRDRSFRREVEVQGDTPEAMAEAFNRLAALLAADVVRDLRTLPGPARSSETP
ncbi:MAG: membrane integrity-associated transporter subunit PqiC [Thiocapsa sp.]|uniref:ABC-type transport auxiliary lipoprotein family protein n=1 Tax=Thiocapsa sp. TaxID=2024551 RepID=UPI001BD028E3|nr:ABC-type transport auxiliary lipoprotein family protein [Thiocapsa sp.]QVL48196.1 MAG: membrane integrity-associated transporter subunit PqiC [Thiocapsa sp.]